MNTHGLNKSLKNLKYDWKIIDKKIQISELIEKNKPLRIIGTDSNTSEDIEVLKGRWGPYLQRGKAKAPLNQKYDYETISLEEAIQIIDAKLEREKASKKKKKK